MKNIPASEVQIGDIVLALDGSGGTVTEIARDGDRVMVRLQEPDPVTRCWALYWPADKCVQLRHRRFPQGQSWQRFLWDIQQIIHHADGQFLGWLNGDGAKVTGEQLSATLAQLQGKLSELSVYE